MEKNSLPQTDSKARIYSLAHLIDDALIDAKMRADARASGRPLGPVTPSPKLTEALGGYLSPGPHILHGGPGSGKTAFALQLASTCGVPAVYVTCEMSPLELFRRVTARVSGQYLGRFKTGEFPIEKARLYFQRAAQETSRLSIIDAACAPLPPSELMTLIEIVRNGYDDSPLIVIDSVHAWASGWQTDAPEYEALNAALDSIRQIALTIESPVLAIAERNRASITAGGQSASAGTRRFEYGAESVIELDMSSDSPDGKIKKVTATISKNRHGIAGRKIHLSFNGPVQTFTEV